MFYDFESRIIQLARKKAEKKLRLILTAKEIC